jgi:hypothetical protein
LRTTCSRRVREPCPLDRVTDHVHEVEPVPPDLERVDAQAGGVEQVVQQTRLVPQLPVCDRPRAIEQPVASRSLRDEVQGGGDDAERIAQLVRDHGEEPALGIIVQARDVPVAGVLGGQQHGAFIANARENGNRRHEETPDATRRRQGPDRDRRGAGAGQGRGHALRHAGRVSRGRQLHRGTSDGVVRHSKDEPCRGIRREQEPVRADEERRDTHGTDQGAGRDPGVRHTPPPTLARTRPPDLRCAPSPDHAHASCFVQGRMMYGLPPDVFAAAEPQVTGITCAECAGSPGRPA